MPGELIPALEELKAAPQWVTWKKEPRDGKPTKVPYRADGQGLASSTGPSTWSRYPAARDSRQAVGADGLGFVLTAADDYCGIDLDHCRDPETGEIQPWAQTIVERLSTYTEISPSGTGLHLWVKAKKPGGRCRTAGLEVYTEARYMTVTGKHLAGTPTSIELRQQELDDLYEESFPEESAAKASSTPTVPALTDARILDLARGAKNGATVTALLAGDTSAYDSDHSRGDQALISLLGFYTQDRQQLDRLFRGSGLYRQKWERTDYRERTIDKALSTITATYGGTTGEIRHGGTSEDVGTPEMEPPTSLPTKESVVGGRLAEFNGAALAALTDDDIKLTYLPLLGHDGWLVQGWSHLVAGYPRCGKTELLIRAVREWLESGHRVLYISEESKPTWALRLRDLSGDWSGLQIVCGLGVDPAVLLERAFNGTEGVVIADTLRNLLQLVDEKDNSEIARKVNPWVAAAREAERTLVMAHHDRKGFGEHGEAIAGGHALLGAFDIAIEVRFDADSPYRRVLENHPRLIDHKRLVYEKRDGEFTALGDPGSLRLEEVRKRVLEALTAEPQKLKDIREAMDDPKPGVDTLRLALSALAAENRARREPDISLKDVRGKTVLWHLPPSVPSGSGGFPATGERVTNLPLTSDPIVGSEVAEYEPANVRPSSVSENGGSDAPGVTAGLLQPCVRCQRPTAFAIGHYPVCDTAPCRPVALELLRTAATAAR